MVTESRAEREEYLEQIIGILHGEMEKVGIQAQIMGRPKHLYSIYQKMTKKGKGFSEIYDLIAVRIIVKSVKDCYSALGAVHTLWHPMPGRFKDYIAMPKFNMYQSPAHHGHRAGGPPLGGADPHRGDAPGQSEYGVAAHWRYKEKGGKGGGCAGPTAGVAARDGGLAGRDAGLPRVPEGPEGGPGAHGGVRVHAERRGHEPARRLHARGLRLLPSTPRWATTAWARR